MRISIHQKGDFKNIEKLFKNSSNIETRTRAILEKYGREGVNSLQANTPTDTGKTSNSWRYEISRSKSGLVVGWYNSNIVNGVPIAVLLQYGHATRDGDFIDGIDYINPALKPIFDKLRIDIWREVFAL